MLYSSRQELQRVYKETIRQVGRIKLLGCTVLYLDFQDLQEVVDLDEPISIGYSTFNHKIDLSQMKFDDNVNISGCNIPSLIIQNSTLSEYLNLWDSSVAVFDLSKTEIRGDSHFENTTFGTATFNNTTFHGTASFCEQEPEDATIKEVSEEIGKRGAEFALPANFLGTEFKNLAIFSGVNFNTTAIFSDAIFRLGGSFKRVKAKVGMHFGSARFLGRVDFSEASLGYTGFNSAHFEDVIRFEDVTFGGQFPPYLTTSISNHITAEGIQSSMNYASACQKAMRNHFYAFLASQMWDLSASFAGSRPDDYFYFENVSATSPIEFTQLSFDYLALSAEIHRHRRDAISLEGANINRGELIVKDADKTRYQLSHATLGAVDLGWPNGESAFNNLYIADTRFDGFDFSNYRRSLIDSDWIIDGVALKQNDQEPLKRETTYSKAKAGAAQQGDTHSESNFLIRERRFRRERYISDIKSVDSYKDKLKLGVNIISNYLYDISCEYGENPRRILSWSISSIFIFSFVYWLTKEIIIEKKNLVIQINTQQSIEYLNFSLQAFTSFFLPGNLAPEAPIIHFISSIESFIGAFLTALFVATIVRTIER